MAPWSTKINLSETNVLAPRIQGSKDTETEKSKPRETFKNKRQLAGLTDPEL